MKWMASTVLLAVGVLTLSVLYASGPPTPQPAATGAENPKILINSLGMKLAHIPAGKFMMGSPASEAERDEGEIQHEVTISKPFYMGIYEVTQREYRLLMGAAVTRPIFHDGRGGGPDHPMENLKWDQAVAFCRALSNLPGERKAGHHYRLPTEAEWEYACRAGTTTPFSFGNPLSSKLANFNGNFPFGGADKGIYLRKTAKVGSYPPNAWGLYDMHGNVAEWCSDFFDKDYYAKSAKVDPQGPAQGVLPTDYNGFYRVVRGGCWLDEGRACRSAYRFRAMPHDPYRLIGFRVVCDVVKGAP
jgi:formylglycine-generating enzyme required for sulfatase activity